MDINLAIIYELTVFVLRERFVDANLGFAFDFLFFWEKKNVY